MSASGLEEVADVTEQRIGGFQPDNKDQVEDFFGRLPDVVTTLARSVSQAAGNMSEEHIHPAVISAMQELATTIQGAVDSADEVFKEHATQHAIWRD